MFALYQHHDMATLAATLAALRGHAAPASPLAAETIVVPNRGTARWLQAELATSEGTATNLELPVPGRFVWQVLRDTLPGRPDSSDYERARLVWHLYALLPTVPVPAVQRYLAAEPQERHHYQLAHRLADVFDQYLIHRRDVLADWEAGREDKYPPAAWQAPVWRALVAHIGTRHRARLLGDFLARAASGDLDTSRLPDPVYAFALADLPADYLRLLYALGQYVNVHFLLPNPSTAYWGDIARRRVTPAVAADGAAPAVPATAESHDGHPLLASLGRAGRDFLHLLYADEFAAIQEPLAEALEAEPPGSDTLLHRIQAGIIAGDAEAVAGAGAAADLDASLQIHACHGPIREMQVLHDRLLDRMAADPELEPRGILVLVPDVARYAPAIHSVFGAASGGRWIPYSVADRPRLASHPIVQTFQQIIELPLSRWTASEVLELAGVPAVMRRFGLDESDLERLRHWAADAGVRWGLDRETRAAAGAGRFAQNTWRFGLDRLLLGLAQQADATLVDGVAPWSDLEGGAATAVGRLWLLLDRLRSWRDALAEATTPAGWQERLNAVARDLFSVDPDDPAEAAALDTLFEATATLEEAAASLADDTLTWEAVREALLGALTAGAERQPLVTGRVTFCGLEPLRGVPFDFICLVGMDDGAFPRQDGQREFNLLQKHPRSGDPSVRDGDRMAFLQALMAARRGFYVSYTGRDVTDGSELQPATVVGELLDFVHGHYFRDWSRSAFREAMVREQPMHPFNPRYFAAQGDDLFTFDGDWQAAAAAQRAERRDIEPFLDGTELAEPDPAEPIDLADLQRFFRHPAQWFFRERLHLELEEADSKLADEEPRALDGLAKHALRQRLFDEALAEGLTSVAAEPSALERARGTLPPPPLGAADHAAAASDVNAVLPLYWAWRSETAAAAEVTIDLTLPDGTRLLGHVPDVGPAEMRRLRPGRLRLKHQLPWWLAYLAVVASGRPVALRLAGSSDGVAEQLHGTVDQDVAQQYLATAVHYFRRGQARPLLFEPYLAEDYLRERARPRSPKSPDAALDSTNGWLSREYRPHHAATEPWLRKAFGPFPQPLGERAETSTFAALVEDVASPIGQHLGNPEAQP